MCVDKTPEGQIITSQFKIVGLNLQYPPLSKSINLQSPSKTTIFSTKLKLFCPTVAVMLAPRFCLEARRPHFLGRLVVKCRDISPFLRMSHVASLLLSSCLYHRDEYGSIVTKFFGHLMTATNILLW